jgi:hypothetical protein
MTSSAEGKMTLTLVVRVLQPDSSNIYKPATNDNKVAKRKL